MVFNSATGDREPLLDLHTVTKRSAAL